MSARARVVYFLFLRFALLALSRFATLTFFSMFLFLSLSKDFERVLTRLLSLSQEYKLMKKKMAEMKALEELAKKQQQDAA